MARKKKEKKHGFLKSAPPEKKKKKNSGGGGLSLAAGGRITIVQNDAARVFFLFFFGVQPLPGERRVLEKRRVFFTGASGVKRRKEIKNPPSDIANSRAVRFFLCVFFFPRRGRITRFLRVPKGGGKRRRLKSPKRILNPVLRHVHHEKVP